MRIRLRALFCCVLALCACAAAWANPGDPERPKARILVVRTDPFAPGGADRAAAGATARRTSFQVRTMAPGEVVESAPTSAANAENGQHAGDMHVNDNFPVYRIRTGDVLEISIPYEPDSTKMVPVRPDGRVNYLFDIEVMAAGKTYQQLNTDLVEALGRYYKNPRVTVIGKSFGGNSVFVMGPVKKPGRHEIQHNTRLLDILSTSGAMSVLQQAAVLGQERNSEVINLEDAYIAREQADGSMRVLDVDFHKLLLEQDMAQNIQLYPRDFIFLPSTLSTWKKIYIVGQVVDPQVYRYTGGITFVEALAQAEGALRSGAWVRRCFIIRGGVKENRQIHRVNYAAILEGQAEDIPLQDGDIVLVPKTPLSKATEIIDSVLSPLRALSDLDRTVKNDFREGHRMYKDIGKTRAFGW